MELTGENIRLPDFYNAIQRPRGFQLAPHHLHVCYGLEDKRIRKLMLIAGPGNGKSTITSQIYPALEIGRDPSMTCLAISGAEGLTQGFQTAVSEIIESSEPFKKLFPKVGPDKARGWAMEKGLFVTGRAPGDPDASYKAVGIDSRQLTGLHARTIIMDDLHDDQNSLTDETCAKVVARFYKTILGRGDPRGARYILSGRRFNRADVYGSLQESGDWVVLRLPAERPKSFELWHDVLVPKLEDGSPLPCWFSENLEPDRDQDRSKRYIKYKAFYSVDPKRKGFYWPAMPSKRDEYESVKRNSPREAESVYQCNPNVQTDPVFKENDFPLFSAFTPEDAKLGLKSPVVRRFIQDMNGTVIQAWDTAAGKSRDSAYSVCVTGILVPSEEWHCGDAETPLEQMREKYGQADRHNRVYVVDVLREKLRWEELSMAVRTQNDKWNPDVVLVEERSSGIQIVDSYRGSDVPIHGVQAKDGKMSRAIDAVGGAHASVQGWYGQHRVVLLDGCQWLQPFINEHLEFVGSRQGKKDQVDAGCYLVNYAIKAGVGMAKLPSEDMFATPDMVEQPSSFIQGLQMLGLGDVGGLIGHKGGPPLEDDLRNAFRPQSPLDGCCGSCDAWKGRSSAGKPPGDVKPFCGIYRRAVTAFDSCNDWREINAAQTLGRGF